MFNWLLAFLAAAAYYASWVTRPDSVHSAVRSVLAQLHPLMSALPSGVLQHVGGLGAALAGAAAGSVIDTLWSLLLPACVAWVVCGLSRQAWQQPDVRLRVQALMSRLSAATAASMVDAGPVHES